MTLILPGHSTVWEGVCRVGGLATCGKKKLTEKPHKGRRCVLRRKKQKVRSSPGPSLWQRGNLRAPHQRSGSVISQGSHGLPQHKEAPNCSHFRRWGAGTPS